jgi:hypothetical protein
LNGGEDEMEKREKVSEDMKNDFFLYPFSSSSSLEIA